jgi:hypothetical protein
MLKYKSNNNQSAKVNPLAAVARSLVVWTVHVSIVATAGAVKTK